MPDYYKPQYLLDFEDRLPSSVQGSDSLSLNSFNSVTSTNLEWDDSAIAPSSEGKRLGQKAATLCCGTGAGATYTWLGDGSLGETGSSTGPSISQAFIRFLSISVVGGTLVLGTKGQDETV